MFVNLDPVFYILLTTIYYLHTKRKQRTEYFISGRSTNIERLDKKD